MSTPLNLWVASIPQVLHLPSPWLNQNISPYKTDRPVPLISSYLQRQSCIGLPVAERYRNEYGETEFQMKIVAISDEDADKWNRVIETLD
jgi:hypothetical protein